MYRKKEAAAHHLVDPVILKSSFVMSCRRTSPLRKCKELGRYKRSGTDMYAEDESERLVHDVGHVQFRCVWVPLFVI